MSGKALKKRKQGLNECTTTTTPTAISSSRIPGKNKKQESGSLQEAAGTGGGEKRTDASNSRVVDRRDPKKNRGRHVVRDHCAKNKARVSVTSD